MRPVIRTAPLLAALATGAAGGDPTPDLSCRGDDPAWQLVLDGTTAVLDFGIRTEMDIPHEAAAENRDWPRALTLVGMRDSGIVILTPRTCGDAPFEALLLTQRGTTPILLSGCCRPLR
ncbi:hypothetical protein KUH32_15105 [Thalassococcus sp. CAU 1522]|uniref:MBL fold metallo-hydrolase n=1 Tax=Thalassococcus arenae TaxID=2851652 RepID=A0ABS6NAP6_9RHOB|nr:hypothetical protein [Thalassococcus arenae]MBV2361092.1 hypothetical protein [Thalassococcus arenae]